jgi:DNA-binding beta-propeller fold protein YncE
LAGSSIEGLRIPQRMRKLWAPILWVAFLSAGLAAQNLRQPAPGAQLDPQSGPSPNAATVVRRVGMIHLRGQPGFASLALVGDQLLMAAAAADSVQVFDVAKRQVVAQVPEMNDAAGIAVDEPAAKAYVANRGGKEIAVLSTRDWKVERRIPLDSAPRSLLLVPQLGRLYSANWHQRSLSVVDLKQGTAHTVAVEGSPARMAWDPGRKQLYVTLEDAHAVAVLSPELEEQKRFTIMTPSATRSTWPLEMPLLRSTLIRGRKWAVRPHRPEWTACN